MEIPKVGNGSNCDVQMKAREGLSWGSKRALASLMVVEWFALFPVLTSVGSPRITGPSMIFRCAATAYALEHCYLSLPGR